MERRSWYVTVTSCRTMDVLADHVSYRTDMIVDRMTRLSRIWMKHPMRRTSSCSTYTVATCSRGTRPRGRAPSAQRCVLSCVCRRKEDTHIVFSDPLRFLLVGWDDERLEDWARLMDRNVSPSLRIECIDVTNNRVSSLSPARIKFSPVMPIPVYKTTYQSETMPPTSNEADEAAEEVEVEEIQGAVAGVGEVRTSRVAAIRMPRGREGMTGRCRRLPGGLEVPRLLCVMLLCSSVGADACHIAGPSHIVM